MRKLLLLVALSALAIPASAQGGDILHRLSVPLMMSQIAVSRDGMLLAAFENPAIVDNEITPESLPIYLFDVVNGVELGRFEGEQTDLTRDAEFTPDGTRLISSHSNGELIVWDVATLEPVNNWEWLPMGGGMLDIMPDGNAVVIASNVGQIGQQIVFDLTTGSITNIYSERPETLGELFERVSDVLSMGVYSLAAQGINTLGELFGVTANGAVFKWDGDERQTLWPESEEGPMRFNVRRLHMRQDDTMLFYDNDLKSTVLLNPDGGYAAYQFGSVGSAVALDGTLAYTDRETDRIYVANLYDDAPAPLELDVDLGADSEGEPIEFSGQETLAFNADGDLVVGSVLAHDSDGTIYVVDIPE